MAYPTGALTNQMAQMNMQQGMPPPQPQPGTYAPPQAQPGVYVQPSAPPQGAYVQPGAPTQPGVYVQPGAPPQPGVYVQPGAPPQPGVYVHPGAPPQPGAYVPQPGAYVQPGAPAQPLPPSVLPSGFTIMDAFRTGNIVTLIAKSSGKLVCASRGSPSTSDKFAANDTLWTVTLSGNDVLLQNVQWPGLHLSINGKHLEVAKKSKHSTLRVHVLPDNYITLESVEKSGTYVAFNHEGNPRNPKEVGPAEDDAHFFVRVERQKHLPSTDIRIHDGYGRPSVYKVLRDESIIQLYIRGTNRYLGIDKNGMVQTLTNPSDKHTFFMWKDRGMGIVTLRSHLYVGFMMRMGGFAVSGKGAPDLNSDFRVHETLGGGVKFESVTCPNGFLAIADANGLAVQEMHMQLVTIQKFGSSDTITKVAIN